TGKGTGICPFQGGIDRHPVRHTVEAIDVSHGEWAPAIDLKGRAGQGFEAALGEGVAPEARRQRRTVRTVEAEGSDCFPDGELYVCAGGRAAYPGKTRVERVE